MSTEKDEPKTPAFLLNPSVYSGSPVRTPPAEALYQVGGPTGPSGPYGGLSGIGPVIGSGAGSFGSGSLTVPSGQSMGLIFDAASLNRVEARERELFSKLNDYRRRLFDVEQKGKADEQSRMLAEQAKDKLEREVRLAYIVNSVKASAKDLLLEDPSFVKKFVSGSPVEAFVMSVDLRKSTSLMLKARAPKDFAQFITRLTDGLREKVVTNYGVFDKFTGDGVLAFFPLFYTGGDAGLYVMRAAAMCHEHFMETYSEHRHCFSAVLREVGLGIGIDFGEVHLMSNWNGLTVVGGPVVYACRLSGAPGGKTYLNERAYEEIHAKFSAYCDFAETSHEVKGEGPILAYDGRIGRNKRELEIPSWEKPCSAGRLPKEDGTRNVEQSSETLQSS